jgi:hypothetical protein
MPDGSGAPGVVSGRVIGPERPHEGQAVIPSGYWFPQPLHRIAVDYSARAPGLGRLFLRGICRREKISQITMKRLAALFFAASGCVLALALFSQGCTNPCDSLAELCGKCADPSYRQACETLVAKQNGGVCSGNLATFGLYCKSEGAGGSSSSSSSSTGGPGSCLATESQCLGQCANLLTSAKFCGNCNTQCSGDTPFCSGGKCVASCTPPLDDLTKDGKGCTDNNSDPGCCGAMCERCGTEQACVNGKCTNPNSCVSPNTNCSGACTNLANDPANCGTCGKVCAAGQICSAGVCSSSCTAGLTNCCGKCVDITSDPNNCGGCDPSACSSGTTGSGGAGGAGGATASSASSTTGGNAACMTFKKCTGATPVCSSCNCISSQACMAQGKTDCSGACVDLASDAKNCGKCGNLCLNGQTCSAGMCISGSCAPGLTTCSGGCVDLQKDPKNCGSCNTVCKAGEKCDAGYCKMGCTALKVECPTGSGTCTDVSADVKNCGTCGNDCTKDPTKPVCSAGTCVSGCSGSLTLCNGSCVDLSKDFNNCGQCGKTCNDNNLCTSDSCTAGTPFGTCKNDSGAVLCQQGNPCQQAMCDPLKGCVNTPLSAETIAAGCQATMKAKPAANEWDTTDVNTGSTTKYCLYCDASKPTDPCQWAVRDDGVACTTDSFCDPKRLKAPTYTDADAKCAKWPCAKTCKGAKSTYLFPNDGTATLVDTKANAKSGCSQDDNQCMKACAMKCIADDAANPMPTTKGCLRESPAVCAMDSCAPDCDPGNANQDSKGCVKQTSLCLAAPKASCADTCNTDGALGTITNKGVKGCVKKNANCLKACAATCDPGTGSTTDNGCVQSGTFCTTPKQCCPDKTLAFDGCSDATDCAN